MIDLSKTSGFALKHCMIPNRTRLCGAKPLPHIITARQSKMNCSAGGDCGQRF